MRALYSLLLFPLLLSTAPLCCEESTSPPKEEELPFPATSYFDELDRASEQTPNRFFQEFLYMLLMLGLILGALLAGAWFLKRTLHTQTVRKNKDSQIQVLDLQVITPKTTVYLLDIAGRHYTVIESENQVKQLRESRFLLDPAPKE